MTELNPGTLPDKRQDERAFWDTFFRHKDRLEALGVKIDQDKVVEIAKVADKEGAKRLLFYATIQSQPTESNVGDFKEIINFLIECGYIDPEDDNET